MDGTRTAAHNALIDALNILSRAMIKAGEDTTWRKQLGNDRQEIGDLADRSVPLEKCVATIHWAIDFRLNLIDMARRPRPARFWL